MPSNRIAQLGAFVLHSRDNDVVAFLQCHVFENIMHGSRALRCRCDGYAIDRYLRRADIGINRYVGECVFAFRQATLRQIQDRLFAPIGFVPIKCVFFDFAVESNQAFHISRFDAALRIDRRGKIERIPNV